ncbi:WSC domain-containing protein [Flammula alnicola]|nr:WSC domain-containing protein [Flammula alnicola]
MNVPRAFLRTDQGLNIMAFSFPKTVFKSLLALTGSAVVRVCVNASPALEARQSSLPAGWVSLGCYTDSAASRTLKTASFTDVNNMTIESCIAFCTPNGYQFAGVEFSRECYCDNVIEAPGTPATDGCNMACTGNAAEICGGADRINIFNNTAVSIPPPPPPATIKQTAGTYQYKGCFEDGVNGAPRDLLNKITVPGLRGVTAESCTSACQAAGFPLAGLEFAQECWCDTYMPLVIPAPDSDCNSPCLADPTELCGAGNRLAIYQDTTATPPNPQQCLTNSQFTSTTQPFSFDLQAVPTPGGGAPVQIGALELAATSGAPSYFLLSTQGIATESHTYTLIEGVFSPKSFEGEGIPIPLAPNVGSTQVFALFSTFTAFNQYCAKPNPVGSFGPFIGPPTLSVSGHADEWALCTNTTIFAPGRVDVVFSPSPLSHDYNVSACQSVVLQMSQPL